ncbi:MAG: OmpA family protein [Deltaproteobacteria bacterium]|nr:MAG: OmpA family protein [Deltaproteobacteria bacterium]
MNAGLAAILAMVALACAPARHLDEDRDRLAAEIERLRANRYVERCAPQAWALAQAHQEFAEVELLQGDGNRARDHLDLALAHVAEASATTAGCAPGDPDGDGITDDLDACPAQPEDLDGDRDEDGCPDVDSDGDGLEDDVDACPAAPEDLDSFKDTDGCPDEDNDGDGVGDALDRCPLQAEVVNGYRDEDGCPDTPPTRVVVKQKQIEILEKIHFELNRATILPDSFPVLDEVAMVILDNPDILVRIEGHTDNVGDEETNLRLSQERARAVLEYLVSKGVPRDRLIAVGFGESQPIDTNRTEEGRAHNRRVEFHILQPQGDGPSDR